MLCGGGEALANSHLFLFGPPTPTAPQSPPPQPGPLPRPSLGQSQTPQECSPVTCAAAAVDVPLPPRPKETQRHLALTQLQKSQEKSCLLVRASAPKSRRGRAGALTSRRDRRKWSGKRLASPFAAARVPYRPRQQGSPSSLLPFCLCNSLPRRLWPHPLLQHEVIASQSRRARQTTSGTDWLPRPPLPLPTQLTRRSGSPWGKKTETAISGKDPDSKSRNRRVILVRETLYSLASPDSLLPDNRLLVPPSLNHRHIKE